MVDVRALTAQDAQIFHPVRLRALKEHPEAFLSTYEEEANMSLEKIEQWLQSADGSVFGGFDEGMLIGIVSLQRPPRQKIRHRAMIGAMYVAPEARGKSVGQSLMDAALNCARSYEGVEDVVLAVTVGNDAARYLYLKAGFVPYSIDPRYIKVDDQYFDIEWMILRVGEHG
jgi:RimJ/RimL family protein N-acetyltransferase